MIHTSLHSISSNFADFFASLRLKNSSNSIKAAAFGITECGNPPDFSRRARPCPEISLMHHGEPPVFQNPPCPWLPAVDAIHDFTVTRRHGEARGAEFYQDALRYAQSQWLAGKPAQAILQLDKAWLADLTAAPEFPDSRSSPYHALAWILRHSADGNCGFPGNPVRHFQHLASRMSGPRAELRAWRAWLCMHLAERVLPRAGFPRDGRQIAREGLWIPSAGRALEAVATLGRPGEWLAARDAMVESEGVVQ